MMMVGVAALPKTRNSRRRGSSSAVGCAPYAGIIRVRLIRVAGSGVSLSRPLSSVQPSSPGQVVKLLCESSILRGEVGVNR